MKNEDRSVLNRLFSDEESPLTMEKINARLLVVEDIAVVERDLGEASRIVLLAIIAHLQASGIMSCTTLVASLEATLPQLDNQLDTRAGLQIMIGAIKRSLLWQNTSTTSDARQ
ncbi:hypothetical protein [Burkholderia ambifaria]|uniref:hypothetical protein n=1 Tax=Burkholderia ambifaria TaxID=152480 RepID=UPI0012FE59FE|nr:hypothetical protein [Burkholderia ambifaria]